MNVWIYRPDIEAVACRLNRHFVYDGRAGSEYAPNYANGNGGVNCARG